MHFLYLGTTLTLGKSGDLKINRIPRNKPYENVQNLQEENDTTLLKYISLHIFNVLQ